MPSTIESQKAYLSCEVYNFRLGSVIEDVNRLDFVPVPLVGIYPKGTLIKYKDITPKIFIAALFIVAKEK